VRVYGLQGVAAPSLASCHGSTSAVYQCNASSHRRGRRERRADDQHEQAEHNADAGSHGSEVMEHVTGENVFVR